MPTIAIELTDLEIHRLTKDANLLRVMPEQLAACIITDSDVSRDSENLRFYLEKISIRFPLKLCAPVKQRNHRHS